MPTDPTTRRLNVLLANPRGFCAGVVRAVDIVTQALARYGPPVYVRHEIVHNKRVVADLERQGAVFVESVDDIPAGATTVFSAHGVSRKVEDASELKALDVIDATCPLVRKVHKQGQRYSERGHEIILIGHEGHAEVEGTRGQIDGRVHVISTPEEVECLDVRDPAKLAYVTQTTLSVSDTRNVITALKRRFPRIVGPDIQDICYATQNRQDAVLSLARKVELLLVVGSANSSNSNRLREIGERAGVPSHLIDSGDLLQPEWFDGIETVGVTAGASAPETLVQEIIDALDRLRPVDVTETRGIEENMSFRLPPRLRDRPGAPASRVESGLVMAGANR